MISAKIFSILSRRTNCFSRKCSRNQILTPNTNCFLMNIKKHHLHTLSLEQTNLLRPNFINFHNIVRTNYYYDQILHNYEVLRSSKDHLPNVLKPYEFKRHSEIDNVDNLLEESWQTLSIKEIIDKFELLSYYISKNENLVNDERFNKVIELMICKSPEFSDLELKKILQCLELCNDKSIQEKTVIANFLKVLDLECKKRIPNWSVDEMLQLNFIFQNLKFQKKSEFVWRSLMKLFNRLKYMTPAQLIQYTFCLKVNRRVKIYHYNLEYYLEDHLDQFNIEEIGIIAMTFLRLETTLKSPDFIIKIMEKLGDNIDTVSDYALPSILRICRFDADKKYADKYVNFIKKLESQVPKRKLENVVQIAMFQKKLFYENEFLVSSIMERCEKELSQMQPADIERSLLYAMTFNINPETTSYYTSVIKELLEPSQQDKWDRYPNLFPKIVHYLLKKNIYHEDLVKKVMDPDFVKKVAKDSYWTLNMHYLAIHYSLEIEHPEYDGPKLEEKALDILLKNVGSNNKFAIKSNERTGLHRKIATQLMKSIEEVVGSNELFHYDILMPHFPIRHILLCYDEKNKVLLSPKEKLMSMKTDSPKFTPNDGNKWYAVIIGGTNNIMKAKYEYSGAFNYFLRQTKLLGYETIIIPYHEWLSLTSEEEKQQYVSNKFKSHNLFLSNKNNSFDSSQESMILQQ
ncbi:hypothetical protein TKK_0011491 [Trichogramma kaykai]|uniref:RAP domain-containing protein n=1 Tax=Trichogramma kaykai TaxID=54128 RepID=A0ABD2WR36_9HYME